MPNLHGNNQYGEKHCLSYDFQYDWLIINVYILDPSDDQLREAFTQYGREKNGSGLSAVEQLARLNAEFPLFNIKCVCSLSSPGHWYI